jgi:membrane protein
MVLLVLGELIGNSIAGTVGYPEQFKMVWDVFRYLMILCSMVFVFAAMYRYTPCTRLTWGEVFPGSVFSTIGWIVVSIGFSFYVNNFGSYSRLYGSIGVVIVLLTWLFLTSLIIMLGGEINATLAFDREGREKPHGKNF